MIATARAADSLVVVGGGQAAAQIIEVSRQEGFAGSIRLIAAENVLPYQRPPLSKQFLTARHGTDWLLYRPPHFYDRFGVDVHLGRQATQIDRQQKTVVLDDGSTLSYSRLALATGTTARQLDVPGNELAGIFYIRTLDDAVRLRIVLKEKCSVVIVGGGFIGLEAAAALVQLGHRPTVLVQQDRVLPRLAEPELASFLLDRHHSQSVSFAFDAAVTGFEPRRGGGIHTLCKNGARYSSQIVVIGIGAVPNLALAEAAGLECADGIIVDDLAVTSDPAIVAAGDCTNHPGWPDGRRLRLETVHNAVEQGRTAGATVAGKAWPYRQAPWVWSDQYNLRVQAVGVGRDCNRTIVRGDPGSAHFAVLQFHDDRLLGGQMVNQPHLFGAVRRLLNECIALTPAEAADPEFDIISLPTRRARLDFDVPWPKFDTTTTPALEWGHI